MAAILVAIIGSRNSVQNIESKTYWTIIGLCINHVHQTDDHSLMASLSYKCCIEID